MFSCTVSRMVMTECYLHTLYGFTSNRLNLTEIHNQIPAVSKHVNLLNVGRRSFPIGWSIDFALIGNYTAINSSL